MSSTEIVDPVTPSPDPNMIAMAAAVAAAVAEAMAKHSPKKLTIGQYDPKSPYHPLKGKAVKPTRIYFQNGVRLFDANTFDEEIRLLNKIQRPGRYLNRKVEVLVRQGDGAEGEDVVEVRWDSRTADQRNHPDVRKPFTQILGEIVQEQNEEIAREEARMADAPQRHVGGNKNYREAVAKREAKDA